MMTNPQARNPKACLSSNSCVPICPVGAKYEAYQDIRTAGEMFGRAAAKRSP